MKNVALITGASSGIGQDLAHIHAELKKDLVIVARSEDKLKSLKKELEDKHDVQVKVIVKDLSDPQSAQEIYDELKAENIEIKYLFNNAGFGGVGDFYKREWAKDESMMMVNMVTPSYLCRLFLPDMMKRKQGKILNVSSTASFLPGPGQAVYYASKAYMQFFSNALWQEVKAHNITVTNLMPGATKSGFGGRSGMDKTALFSHPASSRSVAEAGYKGLMNGDLDVITGVDLATRILIKLKPLIPKKVLLKQIHKAQTIAD
ncbi:SDR family oxidoreductase [bacterium]|nr:SDR family oxidoreductase [bacterium]NCQ55135.1 SDR family oxidoreductase [Candidatus Parcubacteria bacterium]NCS67352.1 SDR family oxidoreductase [Candidatus Peregrinibacteria bacterium]NCS96607.1 SDR family oxidoreductase [bacterium]